MAPQQFSLWQGSHLVKTRTAAWEVCGVEPNPKVAAAVAAAGIDVRVGMLETLDLPEGRFDAVSLHHVIEHLHDPIATLRLCLGVLKPGGVKKAGAG
jgi:SAM-dependent methyltransferase